MSRLPNSVSSTTRLSSRNRFREWIGGLSVGSILVWVVIKSAESAFDLGARELWAWVRSGSVVMDDRANGQNADQSAETDWGVVEWRLATLWEVDWPGTVTQLEDFLARHPGHDRAQRKLYAARVSFAETLRTKGDMESAAVQLVSARSLYPERPEAPSGLRTVVAGPQQLNATVAASIAGSVQGSSQGGFASVVPAGQNLEGVNNATGHSVSGPDANSTRLRSTVLRQTATATVVPTQVMSRGQTYGPLIPTATGVVQVGNSSRQNQVREPETTKPSGPSGATSSKSPADTYQTTKIVPTEVRVPAPTEVRVPTPTEVRVPTPTEVRASVPVTTRLPSPSDTPSSVTTQQRPSTQTPIPPGATVRPDPTITAATSPMSPPLSITSGTLGSPSLIGPADGAKVIKGQSIRLEWAAVERAVGYVVEVWSEDDANSNRTVQVNSLSYTHTFISSGPWKWNVRAVGSGQDLPGPPSRTRSVNVPY